MPSPSVERAVVLRLARLPRTLLPRARPRPGSNAGYTLDRHVEMLLGLMERTKRPSLDKLSVEDARAEYARSLAAVDGPRVEVARTEDLHLGGVPARLYAPHDLPEKPPILVWYHGGGGVIGDLDSYDVTCRALADLAKVIVVSVDYRLAPEHPFPAGIEDALAAYEHVIREAGALGGDPDRIVVGGDSMGACFATVVARIARDRQLPLPVYQLLFYPVTSWVRDTRSRRELGQGYLLTTVLMSWFHASYLPDPSRASDDRVSPLEAEDLSGLPPTSIVTAGFDPLRDEGRLYADRLAEAGVSVRYRCAQGQPHGFIPLRGAVPEAERSFRDAIEAMQAALQTPAITAGEQWPKVCVIGAGSSGIAMVKELHHRGLPFDCFDKSDRVGGNWVFKNTNGMSAAYRSLHINTSRDRMGYADYPMPADYPDYPHHSLIARYFDAYVDHFGFRHRISLGRSVERAEKLGEGDWRVTLDGGEVRRYGAVVVANGHHWDPAWPDPPFPGELDGIEMHAHAYIDPRDPEDLIGKRVVVVGMGNSAMDIACELSHPGVAARVMVAARRGAYVVPHYLFGKPVDQLLALPPWIPFAWRRRVAATLYRIAVGRVEDFGIPKPEHAIDGAHPTISNDFLDRLGRGDLVMKPNLERRAGRTVRFVDGTEEEVDAIIYCTGYRVSFPFFEPNFVSAPDNDLPLFRRVFPPQHRDLFFVGLLQPLGAVMPLAEAQAKWIVEYLTGDYALPEVAKIEADIAAERAAMTARYVASRRHTMQVDFDDYLRAVAEERRAGRVRARGARSSP